LKTKNPVVLVIYILLVGYVIFANAHNYGFSAVFAQKQGNTTSPTAISTSNKTSSGVQSQTLNISKASGSFGSLQNDQTGIPAWIIVGPWKMNVSKAALNVKNPTPTANLVTFNTTMSMVKLDGTAKHKHTISDFKLTSSSVNKKISSATFNGTATITMKEGPVKDVPISIKFLGIKPSMDSGALSIWVDPIKTQNHFGKTPIYSIVWNSQLQ
jgi:hypothetical protein